MPTSVVTSSTRRADCLNVTWGTRGAGRGCQTRTMTLIRTEIEDEIAVVSLADPDRRNALTLPMTTEIVDTFDALEANPAVGAVVITGEPPAFCAGADLSHLSDRKSTRLNSSH